MNSNQNSVNTEKILIVDDRPDNLRLLYNMLTEYGYEVRRAINGSTALMGVQKAPPDLILLDINMPDMNGYEVCQYLKSDPQTRHIPVIFLSASDEVMDKVKAFEVGGIDYITKPFEIQEVLARVGTQLKLQKLNKLREKLSRMIVHDLRNPLSIITLYSSVLIRRSGLTGQAKENLETIYSTAGRLDSMLNDMLMVAKIDSGKLVLKRTPVDINELATNVVKGFQASAKSKKIHLLGQLPPGSKQVSMDANLFQRLLENLISNAIKFSRAGDRIILQVKFPPSDAGQITIRVIDEGIGVSEELRQSIFEEYKVGESISGVSQIGLGLSFCKMVTEAHGGRIFVEDNQPKGAIFTVEI